MADAALARSAPGSSVGRPAPGSSVGEGPALRALPEPSEPVSMSSPVPRLEIPAYDLEAALALERELGVSHTLAQVLVRRDLADPQVVRDFLDPRFKI